MHSKVLCLMGPTASGKTDLSMQLAEDISCEIVSVDSAMVYKTMDIGTAKPTLLQRSKVKHHLIDITDPWNSYSAAKFAEDAVDVIKSIHEKGKLPVLVGGTMLYFKALQQGLSPLPSANKKIRQHLSDEAARIGWQEMHARLAVIDPESAERISPNDPQRIQRALEVYELTHKPLSLLWKTKQESNLDFDFINIALSPQNRAVLHERIAVRFEQMLQEGFIEEVEKLYNHKDLHINLPAIRSVGYRQAWLYLDGQLTYEEMSEKGIAVTRQLAKRQLTWLRHWDSITWFDNQNPKVYGHLLQHIKNQLLLSR